MILYLVPNLVHRQLDLHTNQIRELKLTLFAKPIENKERNCLKNHHILDTVL